MADDEFRALRAERDRLLTCVHSAIAEIESQDEDITDDEVLDRVLDLLKTSLGVPEPRSAAREEWCPVPVRAEAAGP